MEVIINAPVFNPRLQGKAVRVTGFDVEGTEWNHLFLVRYVNGESIHFTAFTGKELVVHLEDFENEDGLKITVLEEELNNGN